MGLMVSACPTAPTVAPDAIVQSILDEDTQIMKICNALRGTGGPEAEDSLSVSAQRELELELQHDFAASIWALDVARPLSAPGARFSDCRPAALVEDCSGGEECDGAKACSELLSAAQAITLALDGATARSRPGEDPETIDEALDELARGRPGLCALLAQDGEAEACADASTNAELTAASLRALIETDGELSPDRIRRIRAGAHLIRALALEDGGVRELARNIDFSFVILVKMIELGEFTDRTIEDVTGSMGWVGGAVGSLLKIAAAELLAAANEYILQALESRERVNRASVARSACGLWDDGESRPLVSTRMLKRTILRLAEDPPLPPVGDVCSGLARGAQTEQDAKRLRRACEKLGRKLRNGAAPEGSEVSALGEDVSFWTVYAPGLEPADEQALDSAFAPAFASKGMALLAAADVCRTQPQLANCINHMASLGLFYNADRNRATGGEAGGGASPDAGAFEAFVAQMHGMSAHLESLQFGLGPYVARMDQIEGRLDTIDDKLTNSASLTASMQANMDENHRVTMALLMRDTQCFEHIHAVWETRRDYLRSMKFAGAKARALDDMKSLCTEHVDADLKFSGAGVMTPDLTVAQLCDVREPFELGYFESSGWFSRCDDHIGQVNGRDQIDALAEKIAALESTQAGSQALAAADAAIDAIILARKVSNSVIRVTIVGHSDQIQVKSECPKSGATSNEELSRRRAETFQRLIEYQIERRKDTNDLEIELFTQGKIVFAQERGVGSKYPAQDCMDNWTAECHKKNRRITLRIDSEEHGEVGAASKAAEVRFFQMKLGYCTAN